MAARILILGSVGLAVIGVVIGRSAASPVPGRGPSPLPYYDTRDFTPRWRAVEHRVGSFHLVDQMSRPVTERDLDGKIHVASFLFAQCPSVCPVLVQKLKPVQEAMRGHDDVLMVSYSVTPIADTPAVLAEFGKLRGIDPDRWRLLTGDLSVVSAVIRGSYFADDDRPVDGAPSSRILHTEQVLLVDRDRRLRGVYNGTNPFEIQRLVEDVATLRASH